MSRNCRTLTFIEKKIQNVFFETTDLDVFSIFIILEYCGYNITETLKMESENFISKKNERLRNTNQPLIHFHFSTTRNRHILLPFNTPLLGDGGIKEFFENCHLFKKKIFVCRWDVNFICRFCNMSVSKDNKERHIHSPLHIENCKKNNSNVLIYKYPNYDGYYVICNCGTNRTYVSEEYLQTFMTYHFERKIHQNFKNLSLDHYRK